MLTKTDRREFLRTTGGIAALTALASGNSTKAQTGPKAGWAIVGLGNYAQYAMQRFTASQQSRIAALVSSDPAKAAQISNRYGVNSGNIYNYENFDSIKENDDVSVVYIITPNGTHSDLAIRAMEAGKHVIVEKTMAATSADAIRMIQTARRLDKKLMVAYRARFEPFNQNVIRMAREEEFGTITSIVAHKGFTIGNALGKNDWRLDRKLIGGGSLVDIGVYSIQACRYIAGAEPVEVTATVSNTSGDPRFKDVEESIAFTLKFSNGCLATGSSSWNYSLQNYFRAVGTKGWVELNPATSNGNLRMFASKDVVRSGQAPQPSRVVEERHFTNIDQLPAMFDHFSDCVLNDKQPLLPMEEGLRDLEVIEAIYESARTGRAITPIYAEV
ncbi:MAG TPA: Gfo/Idh/MocA family oxidoreductase [Pyrinomonadaceae bacterium]|nr:Gfo/Idh/MocA family oxidoreductase [Pyrinomonadaceae bacterium]HMP66150.1 Gfo/Idh/MocA family oxidoreductase [Pyrinomonadaceae bacterium]